MSQPYIGEIRMFPGNFAPAGWALCDGGLLPIAGYEALFTLIGTTYGGDGQATFALPDLRGRLPMHMSSSFPIGLMSGAETVTLTSGQMPVHTHLPQAASGPGSNVSPQGGVWSASAAGDRALYSSAVPNVAMLPSAVGISGSSQPHENMPPFLAVNFIIALYGIFPSPT